MSSREIVHGRTHPAIGNVQKIDPRRGLEHLAGEMGGGPRPSGAVAELSRLPLGERNELAQIIGRHLGACDHENCRGGNWRDGNEVVERVERQIRVDMRIDRDVADLDETDGVAVGLSLRYGLCRKIAAGAGAIFNDDALSERLAELLGGDTRGDIHQPAGSGDDDEPYRLGRIILSRRRSRRKRRRSCQSCQPHECIAAPVHVVFHIRS